jgi:hypothetical protein
MLLDLGALDSVDYFANGELRCVVATEDSDKEALKALLWSNNFREADTEVASYTGCSKADSAIVLGRFLRDRAEHIRFVVHRDRDYMSGDSVTSFERRLIEADVIPLVTDGSDVESYFISANHLHALNPMLSVDRIQALIDQATEDTSDKTIAAIVNLRTEEAFKKRLAGQAPNHGQIAVQAQADYASNPAQYRRGKIVLGRLTALLQQEIGQNPRIFFPSQHLEHARLTEMAHKIWGTNN